jgi:hypothetical protein
VAVDTRSTLAALSLRPVCVRTRIASYERPALLCPSRYPDGNPLDASAKQPLVLDRDHPNVIVMITRHDNAMFMQSAAHLGYLL